MKKIQIRFDRAGHRQEADMLFAGIILPLVRITVRIIMSYQVIALTMAQVRQGALAWQRQLSIVLREHPTLRVYSASPFDLDERRRMKDRFGGDIVYFFNETACQAAEQMGLEIAFAATISEEELPKRRSLVVGIPERSPLSRN